ncbi:MAG: type II secretion system major pseudopilin GspG [Sedimentisphaerales bacterium]|nr:type II secretion system major pseudopilin GspG [Sedimentisphaerales bacterium]
MSVGRKGKLMTQAKRKRRGFTLIELLVVILIISMLAGFVAPNILKRLGKAKADLARPRMATIEGALQRFQLDCGRLPDESEGGLEALLVAPPGLEEKWSGPYLKRSQLLDPWDRPYLYFPEGEYNPGSFDLVSLGADGEEGGEGENADVVND